MSNFDFIDSYYDDQPIYQEKSNNNYTIVIVIGILLLLLSIGITVFFFLKRKNNIGSINNDSPFTSLIYTQMNEEQKQDLKEWERLWKSCGREKVKNKIMQLARGGGDQPLHTTQMPVYTPPQSHVPPMHSTQNNQHNDDDDDDDDEIAEL